MAQPSVEELEYFRKVASGGLGNVPMPEHLDNSLKKTREIVNAVHDLQRQQEDADKKANHERKLHAQTKEKIKVAESDHARSREIHETEVKDHAVSKNRLKKAEHELAFARDMHQAQKHDVSSMLLQMEAMKVEMEAQRKAFVVNVNWAARCTELKVKFDNSRVDYDKLLEQNVQTKSALEAAIKAQEAYRIKAMETAQALEQAREELSRQTEELNSKEPVTEAVLKQLEEWQRFKEADAAAALEAGKGRSKALGVLERQLAQGDAGLTTSSFHAWSSYTVDEKKRRRHKDQAMKQAMKTIANEGLGLVSQVFVAWRRDWEHEKKHQLALANKRMEEAASKYGDSAENARKRALAQLEKQFIGQDKALTKEAFSAWASGKALRKKKEGNMQKGARMIANSGNALKAEIFSIWNGLTEVTRKTKREKDAGHQKALRMIANSGKALCAEIVQAWAGWADKLKQERKKKADGNQKAARMMANSDGALVNICFDSWGKCVGEKRKKEAGGNKALRMINGGNEVLLASCFQPWHKQCGNSKAKEANTAKAVRMIAASGAALSAACFKGWSDYVRKNREKNKKLRAVEKTLGASADAQKLLIVTSWRNTTVVELRKSRGKASGMAASLKTINGNRDLLICQIYVSWARVVARIRVDKEQAKVEEVQAKLVQAIADVTKASEEEVGKAVAEVDRLRGEADLVKKDLKVAQDKAEALDNQNEENNATIHQRDRELQEVIAELEESRRKARDIGKELEKVGIFLKEHAPKKQARPGSGAKTVAGKLPTIAKEPGRPQSGKNRNGDSKGGAPVPLQPSGSWPEDQVL